MSILDEAADPRSTGVVSARILHLAAYDVADTRRLRLALQVAKQYASGGQKSVFECFLTESERDQMFSEMRALLCPEDDRFLLLQLDSRREVAALGVGVAPADPDLYYVG